MNHSIAIINVAWHLYIYVPKTLSLASKKDSRMERRLRHLRHKRGQDPQMEARRLRPANGPRRKTHC